ncbi:hypothetical protein U9M48_019148 [Paspalum notatum var. saurae]|uniref:Uncharacterized protein n=1 Tax=Paspalum notatum var. saurae TaxID=547442 RepID=A0AAQ3TC10_PASNO
MSKSKPFASYDSPRIHSAIVNHIYQSISQPELRLLLHLNNTGQSRYKSIRTEASLQQRSEYRLRKAGKRALQENAARRPDKHVQEGGSSASIAGHQQGIGSSARRPASQESRIEVLTEGPRRGEVRCRIVLKLCGDDVVPTNIILELAS